MALRLNGRIPFPLPSFLREELLLSRYKLNSLCWPEKALSTICCNTELSNHTQGKKCKMFGFSRGYSTNLRVSCVRTSYCCFIFRSTHLSVIFFMRWRQGIQWKRYADRWSVKSVELWSISWVILLFQRVPHPTVDKTEWHRFNVTL